MNSYNEINPKKILWVAVVAYIAIFFFLCFYKYQNFLYDGEDFSIFNNVFYNTIHGNFYWFSIHGGYNYLGDHLELGLLYLLPLYALFQSPITLLFLQTILLGLSAWPIYLITQHLCEKSQNKNNKFLPLIISLSFLLSPFVQNINLEEFHVAPLMIFLFFWTIFFYFKKKYWHFILLFVLTLLTREDTAISLGFFTAIIAWDNRQILWQTKKWWLYTGVLTIAWFFISLKIIALFNPEDQFKYLIFYNNQNIFNPLVWLRSLFVFKNLLIFIGYLLPFLFIPLLKPKYLLILIPTFLQVSLMNSGNSTVLYALHYQAPILVGLFIASTESIISWKEKFPTLKKYYNLILLFLLVAPIYTNLYFGPLQFFTYPKKEIANNLNEDQQYQNVLKLIPPNTSISAPYRLLPNLSSRKTVYTNRLSFLGKKHLSTQDFPWQKETQYLLIDSTDMLEYYLHFLNRSLTSPMYTGGAERFYNIIKSNNLQPIYWNDSLILFKKNATASSLPFEMTNELPTNLQNDQQAFGKFNFVGYQKVASNKISLWWQATQNITDDYFFEITLLDKNNHELWQKIYPPAYGLFPTHNWPLKQYIKIDQFLPENINFSNLKISPIKIKGDIEFSPLNSVNLIIDKKEYLGQEIKINNFN